MAILETVRSKQYASSWNKEWGMRNIQMTNKKYSTLKISLLVVFLISLTVTLDSLCVTAHAERIKDIASF